MRTGDLDVLRAGKWLEGRWGGTLGGLGRGRVVSELAACASGTLCVNLIFLEVTQTGSV